jgi:3-hydroxyisobutyrate dehydrogenase
MNTSSTPSSAYRVAFIGLGVMGHAMAGHLAKAGHQVTVFNRTTTKALAWVAEFGGQHAASPHDAAVGADIALGGNDDGALSAMKPGAVLIDHTTTSATVAREIAAAALERGLFFIDAPVSGGNVGATSGTLTVMCGGDEAAFLRAVPVMKAFAKAVTRLGESGAGQLAKMVNQVAIAGLVQGLAEAIAFGQKAGLDMNAVLAVIGQGAAQSWQMDKRGPTMVDDQFDFGFAVDWMRKDLGLVLDEARRNGARLPVAALVDQFYADLQAQGAGRLDTSSLVRRLR